MGAVLMGRKRWRERRALNSTARVVMGTDTVAAALAKIRCGHPYGDGSVCMAPASTAHAATHDNPLRLSPSLGDLLTPGIVAAAGFQKTMDAVKAAFNQDEETERAETERLLNLADRMVPARGLAEVLGIPVVVDESMPPGSFRFGQRPTYDQLKEAAAERNQFTPDQARTMLSAALGTRPHLAARVIEKLGPVLGGELARAVDAAVSGRIEGYLSAERSELNRLYEDQAAKLRAEQDQAKRGRDVNTERWTTPSRLA